MTALSDVLLVGYAAARERVEVADTAGVLDESNRVRFAAELAVDSLLPWLPPPRRDEMADQREAAVEWLVDRVTSGSATTDTAKAN